VGLDITWPYAIGSAQSQTSRQRGPKAAVLDQVPLLTAGGVMVAAGRDLTLSTVQTSSSRGEWHFGEGGGVR